MPERSSTLPDMQRDNFSLELSLTQNFKFMMVSSNAQGFSHYLAS